jgi:hypothetical protein
LNLIQDAMLDQFADEVSRAASGMLDAVHDWDRARRRGTASELRAATCALAWGQVCVLAQYVANVLDGWRQIGVQPDDLEGRLGRGMVLAVYLATELELLERRKAPAADYEHVLRGLRALAARRTEGCGG